MAILSFEGRDSLVDEAVVGRVLGVDEGHQRVNALE
jgi:hypothetical protein